MFVDYIYLCILIISFIYVLYRRWNLQGIYNSGNAVLVGYILCTLISIHLYSSNQNYWGQNPFALLFFLIVIVGLSRPLYKLCKACEILLLPQRPIIICCIILVILSLWGTWNEVANMSQGFTRLLMDDEYGAKLYNDMVQSNIGLSGGGGSFNYISILTNMSRKFVVFFMFYYLLYPKKNIILTILLVIASFWGVIENVVLGSRNGILINIVVLILTALTFYHFYNNREKRAIKVIGIGILIVVTMGFVAITISRAYVGGLETESFVESYAGQGVLNMGKYGFDNGGIRYGDRTIPWFKSWFTDDVASTYYERTSKYTQLKVDESVFITFVGDFFLDFGMIGSIIIFTLIILFFNKKLSHVRKLKMHHLMIAYILIHIVGGFHSYFLVDRGGNLILFLLVLATAFFFFFCNHYQKNSIVCKNSVYL